MTRADGLFSLTVLDLLVRCTLALLILFLALALLRRRSAALRHFVGMTGMVALVCLPPAMLLLPEGLALLPSLRGLLAPPDPILPNPAAGPSLSPLQISLVIIWLAGSAAFLGRFLAARKALRGFFARAREEPAFCRPFVEARRSLDGGGRASLRVSREVDVPVTFGVLATRILLPASSREWPAERLELVLLHELAHVRRRDLLAQGVGLSACCLFWFHPLVWFLARRLELERERACDDLVLSCRGNPVVYARELVEFASSIRGRPVSAFGVSMARPSQLGRRLSALLEPGTDRRTIRPRQGLLAALLCLAAILPMAARGPEPAAREQIPGAEEPGVGHGAAEEPRWVKPEAAEEETFRGHGGRRAREGGSGEPPAPRNGLDAGFSHRGHPSGDHGSQGPSPGSRSHG